jgi:hypothetical protein
MPQQNDLSRSLTPFEHTTTLVAVIELSQSSWLIAGQSDVKHKATGRIEPLGLQKLPSRAKRTNIQVNRSKQLLKGVAHGHVVVNDEHDGSFLRHSALPALGSPARLPQTRVGAGHIVASLALCRLVEQRKATSSTRHVPAI